ncbi:MAG: VRR-NUC domain-containing protein [[Clostridium] innocuum]
MTVFVTGETGKTGICSFLAHKSQRDKKSLYFKKNIYSVAISRSIRFFRRGGVCPDGMEKDIVAAILRYLKRQPRCFAWKTHGGMYGTAGIPDIIACMDGRFYAFEVKQPGGRLTRLQEVTLNKIEAAGGVAVKVTSVDEVKNVLAEKGADL